MIKKHMPLDEAIEKLSQELKNLRNGEDIAWDIGRLFRDGDHIQLIEGPFEIIKHSKNYKFQLLKAGEQHFICEGHHPLKGYSVHFSHSDFKKAKKEWKKYR
ncbi:MAG: hypothetical protein KKA65_03925 [Nanoarchaeota archaeon]|nr:hypothetical protein [Nanoarchaeota archaeon]MBU4351584.1 hypothetical protein [Nanoarchaeota archaeon]MBU4456625.1 hypothetical protein [Nanoarchaeota archaeon]